MWNMLCMLCPSTLTYSCDTEHHDTQGILKISELNKITSMRKRISHPHLWFQALMQHTEKQINFSSQSANRVMNVWVSQMGPSTGHAEGLVLVPALEPLSSVGILCSCDQNAYILKSSLYIHTCVCMYVCMYVHMHVCMRMYMYIW